MDDQGSALAIRADQTALTTEQRKAILNLAGLGNVPDAEMQVFFHHCQKTGLDPFRRQIYLIGRNTSYKDHNGQWQKTIKFTIQTGIDGYRLTARRIAKETEESLSIGDSLWCGDDGQWVDVWLAPTPPRAAKVMVTRGGMTFSGVALWDEYAQTDRDGAPQALWRSRPAGQLAKCAEALALRRAFPDDLSGLYVDEEMQRVKPVTPIPNAGVPALDALLNAEPAEPVEAVVLITDDQVDEITALAEELQLNQPRLLGGVKNIVGEHVERIADLSTSEAEIVIAALREKANENNGE